MIEAENHPLECATVDNMNIDAVIIARDIEEKLLDTHRVSREEVEQVFEFSPHFHLAAKGHVHGENLYRAIGQTEEGDTWS